MNNDIKSLNIEEEHDIPSQILKTILDCMPQFSSHLYVGLITNSGGQLAELIVYIIPLE